MRECLQEHRASSVSIDHEAAVDVTISDPALVLCWQHGSWITHHMHGPAKGVRNLKLAQRGEASCSVGSSDIGCSGLQCRQFEQRRRRIGHRQRRWLCCISHGGIYSGSRGSVLQPFSALG